MTRTMIIQQIRLAVSSRTAISHWRRQRLRRERPCTTKVSYAPFLYPGDYRAIYHP